MSGFLDRIAARAGGAAAAVSPRVPALFESAAVTTEPAGPAAPGAMPGPLPAAPPLASSGPSSRPPSRREPAAVPSRRSAAVGPRSAPLRPVPAAPPVALPVDADGQPASIRAEGARAPEPGSRFAPDSAQLESSVPVVPAVPAVLAAAALPAGKSEPSLAAQRGPDVIRVSIGRVDVRVPAAPPRQAAPPVPVPAATADRLSLQDYLRGQRGTR